MNTTPSFIFPLMVSAAFAQGPLQPSTTIDPKLGPVAPLNGSGAPQATMRTLYQIEPRTPLVAGSPGVTVSAGGNITISQPGSYYLTGNVALTGGDGITIDSGSASVDLNGFNISTTAIATGRGIVSSTGGSVVITNGSISCSGFVNNSSGAISGASFEFGIHLFSSFQATVSKMNINGISNKAIFLDKDFSTTIDSCSALNCVNGFEGAIVSNSIATAIGQKAIVGEMVSNCVGKSYTQDGITAFVVTNSMGQTFNTAANLTATGIRADPFKAGLVTHSRGVTGAVGISNSNSILATTAVGCTVVGQAQIANRYSMAASP